MNFQIVILPGDGIGPEITDSAVAVLQKIGQRFGHTFHFSYHEIGGCAIDRRGVPLPEETLSACLAADSVLLGAVGGPKWGTGAVRPEQALLGMRKKMGLFANLRPAELTLPELCPLRAEVAKRGFGLCIVRELTSGIYFGEHGRKADGTAYDIEQYHPAEIERIARLAFQLAQKRKGKVTSVDKANVLESSRLWRETVSKLAPQYPSVTLEHMLVDNAAMQLVKDPGQFDVLLTSNLFGDILSDEAAQITGSIGLLPSASLGEGGNGLYEPIHGSAPDLAGKHCANPVATILSAAMMLELSFSLKEEAEAIRKAVSAALEQDGRTADLTAENPVTTEQMTKFILERIH